MDPQPTRVPPQAVDVEQKVLGAMLQSNTAAGTALTFLKPGDFYRQAHAEIFQAIGLLFNRNEPADTVTAANELKKRKALELVGGESYLAELVECAVTPANVEYHANIVREKATFRNLIDVSSGIITRAFDASETAESLLDEAATKLYDVSQGRARQHFSKVSDLLPRTFADIEEYGKGVFLGIPTGFKDLDEITTGLQNSDLLILAGRPSMGKTALALNIAANAAIQAGKAIGIFSLEMSKQQLVQRMLCSLARVNMKQLRQGRLPHRDLPKLSLAAGPLNEARIYIDDSSETTVLDMRAKARRLKAQGNLDLLIVDYLQLMHAGATLGSKGAESREREISFISRSLKGLAKDLDIPVLALSQLSRRTDSREDGRPVLSDLRESGAIEQDADVVMFVYREEVYKKEGGEAGKAEIIVGKQRNGPVGTVNATFIHEYATFENYSPRAEEQGF